MPQKTVSGSAVPNSPRGVAGPPGGLGTGAWWGLTAALILLFGGLFWLAADPFEDAMARVAPVTAAEPETAPSPSGPPRATADPVPTERVEAPQAPAWTLLDVEGAVGAMAPQIAALIEEGRGELPEFKALSSRDATRSARARERFSAWARIWQNRVGRLVGQMPPPEACGVHAAMGPACRSLRVILDELDAVAAADQLDDARAQLETAAQSLELFLNPPEPEPETEPEEGDSAEAVADQDA